MLYPQNGDRIVTTDYVTSRHPLYTNTLSYLLTYLHPVPKAVVTVYRQLECVRSSGLLAAVVTVGASAVQTDLRPARECSVLASSFTGRHLASSFSTPA